MQVEILLNTTTSEAIELMGPEKNGKLSLALSKLIKPSKDKSDIKSVKEVEFESYTIRELETGTIEIDQNGVLISPAKPELRKLAKTLSISLLNSNGNLLNTRQLGSQLIKTIEENSV